MKPLEWIKEHPVAVVGVVGAGIILYMLLNNGSGGATVVQQTADPSLQIAQLQAAQHAADIQAAGVQQVNQLNAQVAIAELAAQTQTHSTDVGGAVSLAGIAAQQNIQLAGIQAQEDIAGYAAATTQQQIQATEELGLASQATTIALANYNLQATQAVNQAQVDIAQIQNRAAGFASQQHTNQSSPINLGSLFQQGAAIAAAFA